MTCNSHVSLVLTQPLKIMKIISMSHRTAYFTLAFVSLLCGAAIYPLFRGPHLLIWNIVPKPGFWELLRIPVNTGNALVSVLVYSGPDFLWVLSGICFLRGLWFNDRKTQSVYLALFYLIAAGYNIGQYFSFIPGIFDLTDLLTMSGVALAEGTIFTFFVRKKHNEKP